MGDTIKKSENQNKSFKETHYRLNLSIPIRYKEYLQEASFKASSPTNRVSITQYICSLIEKDMKNHK